jgi:hypothetical protein
LSRPGGVREMAAQKEQLLLASPSRAIGARLMQKQYMPTALLALDLPAGSPEAGEERAFVGCPKKFDLAISLEHVEH